MFIFWQPSVGSKSKSILNNVFPILLPGAKTSKAKPVLDVTKVELPSGDSVGGPILDMCWDPSGRYLAILFEESHLIAVFCTTQLMMQLSVTPWWDLLIDI